MKLFPHEDHVVFDYETGDLYGGPFFRPVELGLLRYVDGRVDVTSRIVDPALDDPLFVCSDKAESIHGITAEIRASKGVAPSLAATFLQRAFDSVPHASLWAHCGISLDFHLADQEARRADLPPPPLARLRDSAGVYKGIAMGVDPRKYRRWIDVLNDALEIRRRGFLFNVKHLVTTLDLGIRLKTADDGRVTGWEVDCARLGLRQEDADRIGAEGLHRSAFDCVATHALILHLKRTAPPEWLEADLPED